MEWIYSTKIFNKSHMTTLCHQNFRCFKMQGFTCKYHITLCSASHMDYSVITIGVAQKNRVNQYINNLVHFLICKHLFESYELKKSYFKWSMIK